jgi:hypothetical protein
MGPRDNQLSLIAGQPTGSERTRNAMLLRATQPMATSAAEDRLQDPISAASRRFADRRSARFPAGDGSPFLV